MLGSKVGFSKLGCVVHCMARVPKANQFMLSDPATMHTQIYALCCLVPKQPLTKIHIRKYCILHLCFDVALKIPCCFSTWPLTFLEAVNPATGCHASLKLFVVIMYRYCDMYIQYRIYCVTVHVWCISAGSVALPRPVMRRPVHWAPGSTITARRPHTPDP
jgi:hypothetical protein